ncbi:MAG: DUF3846 domain-containing protein [Firmicutes bacterium]|nr:DUF3846 domain-containing protein [Bacillota bacterium]
MTKDTSDNQINVIYCEVGKRARMLKTDNNLGCFQDLVGGWIEEYIPYDDDVAIICNEEGKALELPPNRGIPDENGKLLDVIMGNFFICYAPEGSEIWLDLPPDLEKKYMDKFFLPETFHRENGYIKAKKYDPGDIPFERNSAEYER